MANRILMGNHASKGYGFFVSKPGKNVLSATGDDLIFNSDSVRSSALHQTVVLTMSAGSSQVVLTFNPVLSYNPLCRAQRIDGSAILTDRFLFQFASFSSFAFGVTTRRYVSAGKLFIDNVDAYGNLSNVSSDTKFRVLVFKLPMTANLS